MLADMFDNDVFFDMMDDISKPPRQHPRQHSSNKTPLGDFELGKKIGFNKEVVGESVTNVGGNSFSVSPVVFDASKLDPEITEEELNEIDEEEKENERKRKDSD